MVLASHTELSGVLDKKHHIRPQITLAPRRTMLAGNDAKFP